MTVEAWVYPTSTSGWNTVVMKEQPNQFTYVLYANGNPRRSYGIIFSNGAERETGGGGRIALNTWTHLATTYDGQTIRLYKNGTLVSSTNYQGSIVTSDQPLVIGGNSVWWNEYFRGVIDEVRVYSRPLSGEEITADMSIPIE
jgi:hypothetical protein